MQSPVTADPFVFVATQKSSKTFQVLDLNRGQVVGSVPRERSNNLPPAITPDGKLVLVNKTSGQFELHDLSGGSPAAWDLPNSRAVYFAFVNDREVLIAEHRALAIRDARSGAVVRSLELQQHQFLSEGHVALSPGRRYAAVSGRPIRLVEVATGNVGGDLETPDAAQSTLLSFSPAGDEFAAYFSSRAIRVGQLGRPAVDANQRRRFRRGQGYRTWSSFHAASVGSRFTGGSS